jgi:error-prone DNA polymerase
MGLRFIKGLGRADFRKIVSARDALARSSAERPREAAESLDGFISLSRLPRDVLVSLAESGAFRGFGRCRRDVLWQLLASIGERESASDGGLPGMSLAARETEAPVEFARLDPIQVIDWDYESSGHSTFGHPVEPYREQLKARGLPDAAGLADCRDGAKVSYTGLVICRQMPDNAAGVLFMTMEDETGFVNLIVRPAAFERYRSLILTAFFLGVTGTIRRGGGVVHLTAEGFWRPELSTKPTGVRSRDFH